jgi:hypothetical protein
MSLEQQKNAPNWESAKKILLSLSYPIGFMLMLLLGMLNADRADLNMHRASSKRFQNKNNNLNEFRA